MPAAIFCRVSVEIVNRAEQMAWVVKGGIYLHFSENVEILEICLSFMIQPTWTQRVPRRLKDVVNASRLWTVDPVLVFKLRKKYSTISLVRALPLLPQLI